MRLEMAENYHHVDGGCCIIVPLAVVDNAAPPPPSTACSQGGGNLQQFEHMRPWGRPRNDRQAEATQSARVRDRSRGRDGERSPREYIELMGSWGSVALL